MITCDIVQRLPSGNLLLLPDDYNPNEYVGFVHYVPMWQITKPENFVR